MARALLASETCTCPHTFPQSCQNALVKSQCPREKVGMHLNYFPQKKSKMHNCSKSILIANKLISDGNLLSFLPTYPPKTTLPEILISWEAYQAHGQRSPFDSGFQILLLSHSPDIKAPAPPTRRAFSGTRDSQPCWWAIRDMKLLNTLQFTLFHNFFLLLSISLV